MGDTDLYQQILGLEKPWFVKRVNLQVAESHVDIWLEHTPGVRWPCPKCGQELPCRDHTKEETWWHHCRLEPIRKVAIMLQTHLKNIQTYCRKRLTNAGAEGLNSKIMAIKRRACGYRNKEYFKTAIYFFCGGLSLYPR